jgi:hypothetical protein
MSMNKPLADDIPSVLRRRYKEYRNEGYNDESLRCLNRAADRIEALERKLKAITEWLEKNQPDVFRRGIWDANHDVANTGDK